MIEGEALAQGSYALLTKPGMKNWDVHFYTYEGGSWSSYLEKEPTLVVTVPSQTLPVSIQNFMINIDNLTSNSGTLELIWDKTLVAFDITTETDKAVMANIEKVLGGPSVGDYYAAGAYMFSADKDLDKALMYIQKATHGDNPRFWQVRMEAEVLGKLGRYAEAIGAAKKSKELAQKAGNEDYVMINDKNIAMWMNK